MEEKKVICFDCLSVKGGGGSTVAIRIIEKFSQSGWDVHVLVASQAVYEQLVTKNIERIKLYHYLELEKQYKCLFFRHFEFAKFQEKIDCYTLFTFNYWTPSKGVLITYYINATPFFRLGKMVELVGLFRTIVQRVYSRFALQKSHINLFESEYLKALALQGGRVVRSPVTAYIGTDIPDIPLSIQNREPRIISITSGAPHKRNDLVVRLHRLLNEKGIKIQLVFGGNQEAIERSLSASDREYVKSTPSVTFLGYVSREVLYEEIVKSTVLVTCSEVESFYMVPLEAMSVGCPALCRRFTSIEESVGEAGIVVEPTDIVGMAMWVEELLDESVRVSWSTKAIAWSRKFSADTCSQHIVDIVEMGVGRTYKDLGKAD